MSNTLDRRGFLRGLTGIMAAPALVRVASLMPVKAIDVDDDGLIRWYTSIHNDAADVSFLESLSQGFVREVYLGRPIFEITNAS